MNQYMEAFMAECHDSGIHKHYSKANTNYGCFSQYWASVNHYLSFNSRQSQDGEHMYTCGRFILIFGKTNTIM